MLSSNVYKPGKTFAALLWLLACLCTLNSRAQTLLNLQNSFAAYQNTVLHEKIYVHTNKSFYIAGEILWFKIYNTDGSTNKLLDVSKVAYVEMLDNNHVAVMQAKIALNNGTGNGSLYLPFTISNGNYQLRVYTNWMKNFDADYFFQQQITIINPVKTPAATQQAISYDVQFFPEGGHLVQGIGSKVAFKITASDGSETDCTGAIVNQQNDTIARFKTLKFGIGSFMLTPAANTAYKAVIKTGAGVITKQLTGVSETGYAMQVTDSGEGWGVAVRGTVDPSAAIYMVVHSRHAVRVAERSALVNGGAHFNIKKSEAADGLNYVTLFDEQQKPLCERLIFKRPGKKLIIKASADEQTYATRKKVNLTISTSGGNSQPTGTNLSVSVFRIDSLQKADATNIEGYLWLCADLRGHVDSPDYYLDNDNAEANQALDNLMLSQGWTQFDWSKLLSGNSPGFPFLPEYTGPIITASLVNTLTNKPASGIVGYLTITGPNNQLYLAKSDSAGKLLFNTKNFYGLNEIAVKTNWRQDSTYRIDVVNPFSEQYGTNTIPVLKLKSNIKQALIEDNLNMQVQNVFAAKQIRQFYEPAVDTSLFYGTPTTRYKLDDYTRFTTTGEVLHEYITSISVSSHRGKFDIRMIHNKAELPGSPLVMIDGSPIFDIDKSFSIDPLKVKRLDIVAHNYLYGPLQFYGIMSYTTYKGDVNNFELDPRAVIIDYDGLQLERKFYSPVYSSDQQINSTIPDFRNALYWNPDAGTSPSGITQLIFYTGDKPGHYVGVVEGISANGEAGSQRFTFEVKK